MTSALSPTLSTTFAGMYSPHRSELPGGGTASLAPSRVPATRRTLENWQIADRGTAPTADGYLSLLVSPTSASAPDYLMALLAYAAEQGNEAAFAAAYRRIDWAMRPADDFLRAVRWALAAGAHGAARQLALQGAQRYADHAELQKYARVLAPPRVIRRDLPPRPDLRANRDWIMQHADEYRGKWIALRNGQLLATADSFGALADRFDSPQGILLTRIF